MGVTANTDGSVTVGYTITDSGNSGIARARVVAIKSNINSTRNQSSGILDVAASGKSVVVKNLPTSTGSGSVKFRPEELDYYEKYYFYYAAQDNQGWYNAPPGSTTVLSTPNDQTGTAISNNNGRVYDPTAPTVSVTQASQNTSNYLSIQWSESDSGNSGLQYVYVLVDTNSSRTAAQVKASGTRFNSGSTSHSVSLGTSRQRLYVHAVAEDKQQIDSVNTSHDIRRSAVSTRGLDNNGGYSYDRTTLAASITSVSVNTSTNEVTVSYTLTNSGGGGVTSAYMRYSTSSGVPTHASLVNTNNGSQSINGHPSSYNGSFTISGSSFAQNTRYYFFVTGRHRDTETTGVAGAVANSDATTFDITKPVFTITDAVAQSNGSVIVTYNLSDSGGSGLSSAKIYAKTSNSAVSASTVIGRSASDTLSASAGVGNMLTFTTAAVPSQYTQYYFFAAAMDNRGWYNVGEASAYSIRNNDGRTWDRTRPSVSVSSVSAYASDGSSWIQFSTVISDAVPSSGIKERKAYLRTSSGDLSASTIISSGQTAQAFGVNFFTVPVNQSNQTFYIYVAAEDNQGNYGPDDTISHQASVVSADAQNPTGVSISQSSVAETSAKFDVSASDNVGVSTLRVGVFTNGYNPGNNPSVFFTNSVGTSALPGGTPAPTYLSGNVEVTGLSAATAYDAYAIAVDAAGNSTVSSRLDFTTPDNSAPTNVSISVKGSPGVSSAVFTIAALDNVTVSTLKAGVFNNGASVPTNLTQFNNNAVAVSSNMGGSSGPFGDVTISGLTGNTSYDAYAIAVDGYGNTTVSSRVDFVTENPSVAPVITSFSITDGGNGKVRFNIQATDDNSDITTVEYYIIGQLKAIETFGATSPINITKEIFWGYNIPLIGNCWMTVKDANGNQVNTTPVVDVVMQVDPIVTSFNATGGTEQIVYTYRVTDLNNDIRYIRFYASGSQVHEIDYGSNTSVGDTGNLTYTHSIAEGIYDCAIIAYDTQSNVGSSTTITNVAVSGSAPTVSTSGITSTSQGVIQFTYAAQDTNNNLAGIRIYRIYNGTTTEVKQATHPTTTTISNVSDGYYSSGTYRIRAYDSADLYSPYVNFGSVLVWYPAKPVLSAQNETSGGDGKLIITWDPKIAPVTMGYKVYKVSSNAADVVVIESFGGQDPSARQDSHLTWNSTGTGTKEITNVDAGTYYLRVNTYYYHDGTYTDNPWGFTAGTGPSDPNRTNPQNDPLNTVTIGAANLPPTITFFKNGSGYCHFSWTNLDSNIKKIRIHIRGGTFYFELYQAYDYYITVERSTALPTSGSSTSYSTTYSGAANAAGWNGTASGLLSFLRDNPGIYVQSVQLTTTGNATSTVTTTRNGNFL